MGYPGVMQFTLKQCGLSVLIHEEGASVEVKSVSAHALEFFTFLHILQLIVKSHRRTCDSAFVVLVR